MENNLKEVRKELILHGLSEKTQMNYLQSLKQLQHYYGKSVGVLTKEEIKDYLFYLINTKQLSQSSITIVYSAARFYFKYLHGDKNLMEEIPRVKKQKRLPQVLAREEVKDLINSLHNIKHKCLLLTTYSGGLRVSETAHLLVSDIDSKRMVIRVNQGKGKKDRYTILSNANLKWLREYYRHYRPCSWLFPGYDKNRAIGTRTIQKVFDNAKQKAKITKDVTVHSLKAQLCDAPY